MSVPTQHPLRFHFLYLTFFPAPELPELQIEPGFLPKLKERVQIAKSIEKAQHHAKKDKHDKNWLKEAAEAMDIDLEPDMM